MPASRHDERRLVHLGTLDAELCLRNERSSLRKELTMSMETTRPNDYELRFQSMFDSGHALAFPCDAKGRVDMDALSKRALNNYLYARAFVGREFLMPAVLRAS